ncbi:hypothetical protein Ancab_004093 [Ancistrocladus abbreviatus]
MEALWSLEDKWKISTQGAAILLACTAALTVGVCALATILRQRAQRSKVVDQETDTNQTSEILSGKESNKPRRNLGFMAKNGLMESVQWSIARKWLDHGSHSSKWVSWRSLSCGSSGRGRWRSRESAAAAVWQRPILMGERCELPRFSGLILYDERGRPLPHSAEATNCQVRNSGKATRSYGYLEGVDIKLFPDTPLLSWKKSLVGE